MLESLATWVLLSERPSDKCDPRGLPAGRIRNRTLSSEVARWAR